ncbi:MAG: hypothetical protein ACXABV_04380 [Candidatus Thorarchaeota archaeon]|jgi:hypothetical protein
MKEECLDEVTITLFPPIPGIGIIEEDPVVEDDACGDSTPPVPVPSETVDDDTVVISLAPKDPTPRITEMLQKVKEKFGESVCLRYAKYDTTEDSEAARTWLNAALRGSGDNTVLDHQKFTMFIGSTAPIISINNRLSFVGTTPTLPQLMTRVSAALRMTEEKRLG